MCGLWDWWSSVPGGIDSVCGFFFEEQFLVNDWKHHVGHLYSNVHLYQNLSLHLNSGLNPALILQLGLPSNLAPHSLQRSQYVNGLSEISKDHRQVLFQATGELVREAYGLPESG